MNIYDIKSGMYGLLIGDALGVPYEFRSSSSIKQLDDITYSPPSDFYQVHSVSPGTWSDDGAQALCLMASLLEKKKFNLEDFSDRLLLWLKEGYMAVDNNVFDVGNQTRQALRSYELGCSPEESGNIIPEGKGNGSLMRVLPIALLNTNSDETLIHDAHQQSLVTHGHITNQVCCALYCLMARVISEGTHIFDSYTIAVKRLESLYKDNIEYSQELQNVIEEINNIEANGSGYIIATMKGVIESLNEDDFLSTIRYSICLGEDTDTTAAISGGLAGLYYGFDNIPSWLVEGLRERYILMELLDKVRV